jgi:peptidoglycan/xylan/chitin deacetylase (PgdA/CDA1 family)
MLPMRLTRFIARMTKVRPARIRGRRPIASMTFDDFPKSAWVAGGPILARFRARGTYYTAGGFCGRSVDGTQYYDESDLRALAAAGHEIACHSFAHQSAPELSDAELTQDMNRNADFLKPFLNGGRLESYAYPYGYSSVRTKKFLAAHFSNLRGTHEDIIAGTVDLAQLSTVSLEMRSFSQEKLDAAIARAKADNGWICFYTHGVSESPGRYDSTPAILAQALECVTRAGIEILPMREAVTAALG